MSNRSLLAVIVLVAALAAGGAWYLATGVSDEDSGAEVLGPGVELTREPAPEEARTDLLAPAPEETIAAAPRTAERVGVVPEAKVDEQPRVPSSVIWLKGRVIFPPNTPEDESIVVLAHGKRFPGRKKAKGVYEAQVDENGEFRVAFMPKTTRARLTMRGRYAYLAASMRFKMDEAPEELVLEPLLGGRIVGRMTLPEPVEGEDPDNRKVMIEVDNWNSGAFVQRVATTRADGAWEINCLPPADAYAVESRSLAFTQITERDVIVVEGETLRIDTVMTRGATLRGVVVDGAGKPVERAQVQADTDGRFRSKEDLTDAEGRFEITGLTPGDIEVEARHKSYLEQKMKLEDVTEGEVRGGLRLVFEGGGVIEGLVQWPDGSPAVRAMVRVDQQQGEGWRYRSDRDNSFKTEEDGAFRFSGLGVEPCTLQANARPPKALTESRPGAGSRARWRALRKEVVPDTGRIVLVLEEAQALVGRVVDDRGEAVTRFHITLRQRLEGTWTGQQYNKTFSAEDGAFEFEGIAPGAWTIDAKIINESDRRGMRQVYYSGEEERVVQVPQTEDLLLRLDRPVRLAGVVLDPAGQPQSGAKVRVSTANQRRREVTSDSSGAFEITDVKPGAFVLEAEHDLYANSTRVEVQAAPASAHEGLVLALRIGGIIKGEVSPAAGDVAGRQITVMRQSGNTWKQAKSDDDGRFEIGGLMGGTYQVHLQEASSSSQLGAAVAISGATRRNEVVEVVEGQTAHVVVGSGPDDPVSIRGRVTAGGEPLADIAVRAQRSDGNDQAFSGQSDAGGAYQVVVDGPGKYKFQITSGPGSRVEETIDVPEGPIFTRNFELPTGVLSGTVSGPAGPAQNVPVLLSWKPDEKRGNRQLNIRTDADGRYVFAQLEPGSYTLRAGGMVRSRASEFGLAPQTRTVEITASPGSAVDFRLQQGGRIEGSVVDASGTQKRGYQVHASTDGGSTWSYVGHARSDRPLRAAGFESGTVLVRTRTGGEVGTPVEVHVTAGSVAVFEIVTE